MHRSVPPRAVALGAAVLVAACRSGDPAPANDTAAAKTPPRAVAAGAGAATPAWPAALGGVLLVPGANPRTAVVLLPDSTPDADALAAVRGAAVQLLGAGGRTSAATIAAVEGAEDQECVRWPSARLQFGADSTGTAWTLAARANTGTLVPLTALGDLSPRESAVLTADLARLASALPMDTVAAFRGLPFVVRAAHVARVGGRVLLVAEVTRRVAQAASPLEQRVAVVADRDTTPGARWTPQWWERVDGSEETIEATDAVGVVAAAPGVAVLLQRESSRGVRYELVWGEGGTWGRRWTSGWGGC